MRRTLLRRHMSTHAQETRCERIFPELDAVQLMLCAARLVERQAMQGEKCDESIDENTRFCAHCGARQKAAQHVVWPACGIGCLGAVVAVFGFLMGSATILELSNANLQIYFGVMWTGVFLATIGAALFAWRLLRK